VCCDGKSDSGKEQFRERAIQGKSDGERGREPLVGWMEVGQESCFGCRLILNVVVVSKEI
jgi:hypothetical protein